MSGLLDKNGAPMGDKKEEQKKPIGHYVETAANMIVDVISIPVSFVANIMGNFMTPGSGGTRILGFFGFCGGVLLSADGVWQTLFRGTPLFPFYESHWVGWFGWLRLPFNLLFWLSITMSALVQVMEARTVRGKAPVQAKAEFEDSLQHDLPSKPTGKIDLSQALWGDYKKSGMRQRSAGGAIALFFWIFDLVTTFASRNPFRYSDPAMIIGCFAYNLVTMCAGEIGFWIWRLSK